MHDFPAIARPAFEANSSFRTPTPPTGGMFRHRHWPPEEPPHEIIWSEVEGRLIDLAADARALAAAAPVDPGQPTAPAGRILLVEDDAAIRDVLADLLRRAGYNVSCADDGEAGWAALCAERPDVLITDHAMPRLTGLDLVRRMRASADNVPVVMISGEMPWNETDLTGLLVPGATLEKPFSLRDLLAIVNRFLSSETSRACETRDGHTTGEVDRHPRTPRVARTAR